MSTDLAEALGENIPLSEMLETLRLELLVAEKTGKDSPLAFSVDGVDIELSIVVGKGAKLGAKAKIWVLSAEASKKTDHQVIHKFTLHIKPIRRDGGTVAVSGKSSKRNP